MAMWGARSCLCALLVWTSYNGEDHWVKVHLKSEDDVVASKVPAGPRCSGDSGEDGGQITSMSWPGTPRREISLRSHTRICSWMVWGARWSRQPSVGQGKVACATHVMAFLNLTAFASWLLLRSSYFPTAPRSLWRHSKDWLTWLFSCFPQNNFIYMYIYIYIQFTYKWTYLKV